MTIQPGERLFVDTNVLLSATDRSRRSHAAARSVIERAGSAGWHLYISGQVVREYLVVATRPMDANGLGLRVGEALANVDQLLARMTMLEENEAVGRELRALVASLHLTGKRMHDAGIAATMIAHAVDHLVTDNLGDFGMFSTLRALGPDQVARALD